MRKFLFALLLLNSFLLHAQLKPSGILLAIKNAKTKPVKQGLLVTAKDGSNAIEFNFQTRTCLGINKADSQWYVFPFNNAPGNLTVNTNLWVLPQDPFSKSNSYFIKLSAGDSLSAVIENDNVKVNVYAKTFELFTSEARPHSDCFNNRYTINIQGGDTLANALAGVYWGTMLQSVVEKTKAKNYPYSSGYVISTLNPRAYAGSYPDVDHEFQIKGRLAFASDLDVNVVKRMIELQFKLMQDDPEGLFRAPCSAAQW